MPSKGLRRREVLAVTSAAAATSVIQADQVAAGASSGAIAVLEAYRWRNRLLLIFAPDADGALQRRQHEMLAAAEDGLNERQMVVMTIAQDSVLTKGQLPATNSATELRNAYDVSPDEFQVLLIGKDGGVKLRQGEPVSVADLFALIDSMPMRQREMRQNS